MHSESQTRAWTITNAALALITNEATQGLLEIAIRHCVGSPAQLAEPSPVEPEHKTIACSDGSRLPGLMMLQMLDRIARDPRTETSTSPLGDLRYQQITILGRTLHVEVDVSCSDVKISLTGPDWHLYAITVGDGYKVRGGGKSLLDTAIVIVNPRCRNAENFHRDLALLTIDG